MAAARAALLGAILLEASLALLPGAAGAEEDELGRVSYSLGHQIGADLAAQDRTIDEQRLLRGLKDGLGGAEAQIPADEMQALLLELKRGIRARQRQRALGVSPAPAPAADAEASSGAPGRLGYSIGYQVGGDFRQQGIAIDPGKVLQGVHDARAGVEPAIPVEQMRAALVELQQKAEASARVQREEEGRRNAEAGKAFLAANAAREGVTTTASGLQYEVIAQGSGPHPEPKATVKVQYRGTLLDGTEFDSSYARHQAATLPLGRVIAAWQEALPLMTEGSTWKLFVPPDLAYGERGAGTKIPPNATLIFEIELLSADAR